MPHVKKVSRLLYELRVRGEQEVRIFFTIQDEKVFFIHGFIKKTQKTPRWEIEIAEKRLPPLT